MRKFADHCFCHVQKPCNGGVNTTLQRIRPSQKWENPQIIVFVTYKNHATAGSTQNYKEYGLARNEKIRRSLFLSRTKTSAFEVISFWFRHDTFFVQDKSSDLWDWINYLGLDVSVYNKKHCRTFLSLIILPLSRPVRIPSNIISILTWHVFCTGRI